MRRAVEPYLTKCASCGLTYMAADPVDEPEHRRVCKRWSNAVNTLRYEPEQHTDRENAKHRGHALLRDADAHRRALGAELIVRAWFDRSLAAAINGDYWRRHPELPQYTAMMDLERHFPAEVVAVLRARVGRRGPGIADGSSYWSPPAPTHPNVATLR